MAPGEKHALVGLLLSLCALAFIGAAIWSGLDFGETPYGGLIVFAGIAAFAVWLGVCHWRVRKGPEDEREMLIRLKANNVAVVTLFLGFLAVSTIEGSGFFPVSFGVLWSATWAASTAYYGSILVFYRRGL